MYRGYVFETKPPTVMAHYHLQFDDNRWLLFPRPSVINDLVAAYKETDTLGKDITNVSFQSVAYAMPRLCFE